MKRTDYERGRQDERRVWERALTDSSLPNLYVRLVRDLATVDVADEIVLDDQCPITNRRCDRPCGAECIRGMFTDPRTDGAVGR